MSELLLAEGVGAWKACHLHQTRVVHAGSGHVLPCNFSLDCDFQVYLQQQNCVDTYAVCMHYTVTGPFGSQLHKPPRPQRPPKPSTKGGGPARRCHCREVSLNIGRPDQAEALTVPLGGRSLPEYSQKLMKSLL